MFNCQRCGQTSAPGEPEQRVVAQTRAVDYPPRYDGNKLIDKGGRGLQIVREMSLCRRCANGGGIIRELLSL